MYRNKERRKTDETGYKKVKNIIIGLNIVNTRTNMCILPHCCFPQINKALILLTLIYFCSWNKRKELFKQIFIIVLFDKWRGEGGQFKSRFVILNIYILEYYQNLKN